jgi:outer membrane protein assembly factor BamB
MTLPWASRYDRWMVATRHVMCEVELVEGDAAPGVGRPVGAALPHDGGPLPPASTSGPTSTPGPRPRRPRGRTVAAVLVSVLVVAGGEVASQARARSAAAALAGVDGVLAPLAGPVTELWRSERALRSDLLDAAGLLVGVVGRAGQADVVALDPASGATVWRTPARPLGPGDGGGGVRCVAPDAAPAAAGPADDVVPEGGDTAQVVACVIDRTPTDIRGDPPPEASLTDRVIVLDARTGAVVSERPVPRSTTLDALGGDMVTAHGDPEGYVHVSRTDPSGSSVRWEFVSPRPLPVTHPGWGTRMRVTDGLVVVDEADGWLLDGDGTVLQSWASNPAAQLEGTTRVGAGRMLTRPHTTGGPYPRTRVADLVTEHVFTVPGRPLAAWPDDGSLDGSFLARSGGEFGLAAYDPATGTARWSAEGQVEGRALVLDGRVLRVSSRHLTAVDGRTGETVWQTLLVRPARTSLVTDGRLVLVTQLDGDRGLVLGAYGLDDGRLRWTSDIADDVAVLTVFGRQLFGWTGEHLVALSAPP